MKQERISGGKEIEVSADTALQVHDAEVLTAGKRKAIIILGEQAYTLHITRQGKLLLTK